MGWWESDASSIETSCVGENIDEQRQRRVLLCCLTFERVEEEVTIFFNRTIQHYCHPNVIGDILNQKSKFQLVYFTLK